MVTGLDWFEVEVVVEVEVVEVLAVDEEVQHVVALPADLEPRLHPVQLGGLEELGRLEGTEEVPGDPGGQTDCHLINSLTSSSRLWEVCV